MRKSLIWINLIIAMGALGFTNVVNAKDEYPLHMAAANDDIQLIKHILSQKTLINARDETGSTALMVATRANNIHAAHMLIEAGADVNAKDNIQDSPYLYAGAQGYLKILRMTLMHGADLKSTNRYGGTALIPAAERGHVETVRTLIAAGINVNHVNNLGWTALLEAIILGNGKSNYQQIVALLLKAGANPNLADKDGITPLQHARTRGYREIEKLLLVAGAK
ncbi:ankyrin repeat domain-containing protein [Acinetobacter baumannii]|uniref:ankyrin repeat domain-containing protein n=1 Tax=Acinetobacter baumannii TaxID=470 RepID=UPI000598DCFF|nr:ankyrin repeat domain-containing protein [Acinetobacter baumannii]EHU2111735.1 ankyrin repeat domain-containing protein [Acinetobacter baumannii]EHZ6773023.1 ankyrin repeat domain-containing protein [Acinetobacter baumannii]EKU3488201.1 ankyrin repeat domain-containing protein [Acinetobacter baumannii]EKU6395721.1 ankyrin repeat domain-containing protein [Acinetobacter baumannii]EKU8080244.1 ankyrin repeat domain-containing protein [Acinetobacter baumannii]